MDALNGHSGYVAPSAPVTGARGASPTSTAYTPSSTNAATSPAATGAHLAQPRTDLSTAIARLTEAVNELQRVVAEFARRMAARTSGAVSAGGGAIAQNASHVSQSNPVQGGGAALATNATSRASAIPMLMPGSRDSLRLACGQVTYRQIPVTGAAGGTTITAPTATSPAQVELYALRDFQRGAYRTQVLEPVTGSLTIPAGETVKLVARIKGTAAGDSTINIGGASLDMHVGSQSIDALPMMAWVNESNAKERGANIANLSSVLAHFGVAATGNSGVAVTSASNRSPVQYYSAAYEGATRQSPAETARRIVAAERSAAAANPGAAFWVQVSDEQDKNGTMVAGTVDWIRQLRSELAKYGSNAKLFVAAQARDFNLSYASVIDGWATTQTAVSRTRDRAIADIQAAARHYGRSIELMEYPGNAFFDAGTPGGAAVSTASAALDGASSWFIYSANNHDVLEAGGGDEGRGDIGGLVAIDNGRVLPTIALIEAELGANLGSAARAFGGAAVSGSGAAQVAYTSDRLDAYRHSSSAPDLREWEAQIARYIS